MRLTKVFTNYREALVFRNRLMFSKGGFNPRLSKKGNGWKVTYNSKKFMG